MQNCLFSSAKKHFPMIWIFKSKQFLLTNENQSSFFLQLSSFGGSNVLFQQIGNYNLNLFKAGSKRSIGFPTFANDHFKTRIESEKVEQKKKKKENGKFTNHQSTNRVSPFDLRNKFHRSVPELFSIQGKDPIYKLKEGFNQVEYVCVLKGWNLKKKKTNVWKFPNKLWRKTKRHFSPW